ncbi:MAG: rhodanese-like domain-containing protein [Desulfarculus sp.]|nr:rhodanese-like domain-containing protein [Desulfarculus sp.]
MKKVAAVFMALAFMFSFAALAAAAEANPLVEGEKAFHKEMASLIPADKLKTVDDLYKKWEEVIAGKSKAILLDVRTHPEFDAFHIEGSSHIHAGHMYTIPKKIKDAEDEIWVFCRTDHRAKYVGGFLYKYGYKNVYVVVKDAQGVEGGIVGWVKKGFPVVNYFFGYADKSGVHYSAPPLKERNCGNYIREFDSQRGETCDK